MTAMDDLTCRELVETATEYLDGALTPRQAQRFEEHLAGCLGCETYLRQLHRTIGDLARLSGAALSDARRESLLAALRARSAHD